MDNSKRYSCIKYTLAIAETAYLFLLVLIFLASGWSAILSGATQNVISNKYAACALYLAAVLFAHYLLNFALNFYHSFALEHRFGLSKQKLSGWLLDQFKAGLLSYLIIFILLAAFYKILQNYPDRWWLVISLFWIFFSLILARLTPVIIIPLFFKYKRLSDEALRQRIFRLAEKMHVRLLDCFQIDFSKKTLKANAAFLGWGKTKRVILADTLKDKYTVDEIEVILAHEFAHYRLKHLFKLIALNSFATVLTFYLIFKTSSLFLGLFNLSTLSDIAALPLILLYFLAFGIIMQPWSNFISRIMERNADMVALEITGLKGAFISMMEKLAQQNLADRKPYPLIKFFFFDHPPIDERIKMAQDTYP